MWRDAVLYFWSKMLLFLKFIICFVCFALYGFFQFSCFQVVSVLGNRCQNPLQNWIKRQLSRPCPGLTELQSLESLFLTNLPSDSYSYRNLWVHGALSNKKLNITMDLVFKDPHRYSAYNFERLLGSLKSR